MKSHYSRLPWSFVIGTAPLTKSRQVSVTRLGRPVLNVWGGLEPHLALPSGCCFVFEVALMRSKDILKGITPCLWHESPPLVKYHITFFARKTKKHSFLMINLSCCYVSSPASIYRGDDRGLKQRTSVNKTCRGWWEKKEWKQNLLFFILSCVNNKAPAPAGIIHAASSEGGEAAAAVAAAVKIRAGISHPLVAFSSSPWHQIVWVWHQTDVLGAIAAERGLFARRFVKESLFPRGWIFFKLYQLIRKEEEQKRLCCL